MKGLVHVYTGEGKGKTTCSLGMALRVLGWGKRVCVLQFIKGYIEIGEKYFSDIFDRFDLIQFSHSEHTDITLEDVKNSKESCEKALSKIKSIIESKEYDLVILDEINGAIAYDLVDLNDVIEVIKNKPEELELILTGRYALPEIIELADYATEMRLIKHPYQKGILARKYFDY